MSDDFDPLAYSQQQAQQAPPSFDPLAYAQAVVADPSRKTEAAALPETKSGVQKALDEMNSSNPVSEAAGHMISGVGHTILGGYKGLLTLAGGGSGAEAEGQVNKEAAKTFQPTTAGGKAITGALESGYNPLNWPQKGADILADKSADLGAPPSLSTAIKAAPTAIMGALGLKGAPAASEVTTAAAETAQNMINAAASGKSMGAASTAANIMQISPELQKAVIDTTRKTGGAVNPEILTRRIEADSLPVKMNLTEGQATQDPSIISNEQNMRGKHMELAQAFNQQNGALVENLRAIRESAGPDVFSTNPVEHGDTLIQAYKDKGAAADAQISANYKALKDAAGGAFPVDANALLTNSTKALHNDLLFDHAPKAVMSTLGRLADNGNMTFENFEALRTNLARIQRSSQDGNERAAAGVIRNQMEALPLAPGAAALKPLADTARESAKAQFQALDADPAYKAAVNNEVPPDKFVSKFITGPSATRDSVATMRANLVDNDRAAQTMGVAALDHLRDQAKIDNMGNGNFAAATFNKHLEAMRPKLQSLVPPEQTEQLDTLGKVARYTTAQPKGSFVNNSNTLTGALASHGANILENVVPYGNLIRKGAGMISDKAAVKRALDPASGLERLRETGQ
jgi:hypothetical protein